MDTLHPSGYVLGTAIVTPSFGLFPLAVIPFALGLQHIVQWQYAVMVAIIMLVVKIFPYRFLQYNN